MRKIIFGIFIFSLFFGGIFTFSKFSANKSNTFEIVKNYENEGGPDINPHPLSIETLRNGEYPGSEIVYEQTLSRGSNYGKYVASYRSEGLKIYALLTIPEGEKPVDGYPAVIFNHGYISPSIYKTTERYIAYQDAFARNGYVTFKSDYRGHGNSEGQARGGYSQNDYTIDILNAVTSIKMLKLPNQESIGGEIVDSNNIGMWGHSMGGHMTLEAMVVTKDIKAGVIWAGVVGSYQDLVENWRRNRPTPIGVPTGRGSWRQELILSYGMPQENPQFWNSLSATNYLNDLSGPIQLHHGEADTSVPVEFSQKLYERILNIGKYAEIYTYPGDDHNISTNLSLALKRSVDFFDKYLKDYQTD
jgi:dipeptidyl aminopeptidase/acylaminoacyl peptidase